MKKGIDWRIIIAVVICITALEAFALSKGINGTILTLSIGILAGIGGLSLPQLKTK
tara:strand:+ start:424 stop:591 length:168 start_codon:yes stop_codon:yes gene_type:complete